MAVALKIKESIASSSWIRKMFEEGMRLKQIHGADNVFDFSIGNPDAQPPKKFFSLLKRFAEEAVPGKEPSGRTFNKRGYMAGKIFTTKNNYYPLPQDEILNSQKDGQPTLVQNAGY